MEYTKTAAAYIRVSTDDQAELSPDSQLVEIRKFAEREGYLLLDEHIYKDLRNRRPEVCSLTDVSLLTGSLRFLPSSII